MNTKTIIKRHHLRIRDASSLSTFYVDLLGMQDFGVEDGVRVLGYDSGQCLLAFHSGATMPLQSISNDFYWKIGITLHDLDGAVSYLRRQGHSVADPVQFRDIGYLTHITDPDGLVVELLQQGFQGRAKPVPTGHPIGAQATIAHITLRVADIEAAQRYFVDTLGMRLMSVQPVESHGFSLYFYAFSDEDLPDPDLKSVANREWLWSRPYALIELQHLMGSDASIRHQNDLTHVGFLGLEYEDSELGRPNFISVTTLKTAL